MQNFCNIHCDSATGKKGDPLFTRVHSCGLKSGFADDTQLTEFYLKLCLCKVLQEVIFFKGLLGRR